MIHNIISINKYDVQLDLSVKNNLKSFKEEVLDELYRIFKIEGDIPVLFSGGMDSTFILRSLLELGLKPRTVTLSFTKDNSDFDCELAKQKCKKYGLASPEFFYMDDKKFFQHLEHLLEVRDIAYPMLHGFFMDYFLNTNKYDKFYCGMQNEYRLKDNKIYLNPGPYMVKVYNPDRLYNYTTDRTFLSYFKHKQFLNNYKQPQPRLSDGTEDMWYIRDLIYMDCYPDIPREVKELPNPWRNYIKMPFIENVLPYLTEKYPHFYNPRSLLQPCTFSADFLANL